MSCIQALQLLSVQAEQPISFRPFPLPSIFLCYEAVLFCVGGKCARVGSSCHGENMGSFLMWKLPWQPTFPRMMGRTRKKRGQNNSVWKHPAFWKDRSLQCERAMKEYLINHFPCSHKSAAASQQEKNPIKMGNNYTSLIAHPYSRDRRKIITEFLSTATFMKGTCKPINK